MQADAQKPLGQAVGRPGWAWGMMLSLWCELLNFLVSLPVGLAV